MSDGRERLAREYLEHIPLARAMALEVRVAEIGRVVLSAPLAPNVNDKGCAFGGSLASLLTLAAWGIPRLATWDAGIAADIYVRDSTIRYRRAVWTDFTIEAAAEPSALDAFLAALVDSGRGRIELDAWVAADAGRAAELRAHFVALPAAGTPTGA